tara:strand:- start:60 stop:188 length:129 start_codon:yes stop_codon:yes gene_type:complete
MKNNKEKKVVVKKDKVKKIDYSKRTMSEAIAASATESLKFRM